jgi:hypothetical protein
MAAVAISAGRHSAAAPRWTPILQTKEGVAISEFAEISPRAGAFRRCGTAANS